MRELMTSISCSDTVCTTSLRFCSSPSGHCTNLVCRAGWGRGGDKPREEHEGGPKGALRRGDWGALERSWESRWGWPGNRRPRRSSRIQGSLGDLVNQEFSAKLRGLCSPRGYREERGVLGTWAIGGSPEPRRTWEPMAS